MQIQDTHVQQRIRVCSVICRPATQGIIVQHSLLIYRDFVTREMKCRRADLSISMQQMTSSAVPRRVPCQKCTHGTTLQKGWRYRSLCSNVATGGFVNSVYWLHCKPYNLYKSAQSSGALYKCVCHRISLYNRLQRSSVISTFGFEEVVMPVYQLPYGLYPGHCH